MRHLTAVSSAKMIVGTTLDFGYNDVCVFELRADSEYAANKFLKVQIAQVTDSDITIAEGSSLQGMKNVKTYQKATTVSLNPDKLIYIIIHGKYTANASTPANTNSVQIVYWLEDKYDFWMIVYMYGGGVGGLLLITIGLIILAFYCVIRHTFRNFEKKIDEKFKESQAPPPPNRDPRQANPHPFDNPRGPPP